MSSSARSGAIFTSNGTRFTSDGTRLAVAASSASRTAVRMERKCAVAWRSRSPGVFGELTLTTR